jgi:hypothetical protein
MNRKNLPLWLLFLLQFSLISCTSNITTLPDQKVSTPPTQEQATTANEKAKTDASKIDPKATSSSNSVYKPVDPGVEK